MKKFLFILSLILQSISYAIGISPEYFEKEITTSDTGYREYIVKNDSANKVRYKVTFEPKNKEDEKELDISVYPKILFIEPYSEKTVKVLVKAKTENLKKDEYIFNMTYSPITIPTLPDIKVNKDEIGIYGTLEVGIVIEVIGYKETKEMTKEKISILDIKNTDKEIVFKIQNNLNRSIKLDGIISDGNKSESLFIPRIKKNSELLIKSNIKTLKKVNFLRLIDRLTEEEIFSKKL